ncbi:hypothetical protein [Dyadobacter arcticus]|uniref:Outer membrane protein beta-barrel domain-containing protein n=1 Tax=Dyadobacter arcticus TaxID=1078754 RepID=A0ABX0UH83_9BACT|nr:hypothetical protein [Dyadobacter arcticus]NIJ51070.1 hypothetical protein [Dyadobacter arcticus]
MKSLYAFLVLFAVATAGYGQNQSNVSAGIDVGTGFQQYAWGPSVLYHEEIGFNKAPWLKFGLGIRGWGYYGGRTNLFTKDENNYLEYGDVSANGLSFVIGANISFWRIDLGVNTDLAGLSFGSKRHGYYEKTTTAPGIGEPYYNTWLATSPVLVNALPLALKNYNGQSEAYARIHITRNIGIKLGYVYGQIAYATKKIDGNKVLLDDRQRRFYNTYGMPYAALSFAISD